MLAASVGGNLSSDVILLMGFANLIADGLSMGFGDYLSSQAEVDYTKAEHTREKWELDNYPEGEKREMVELYMKRGMTEEDAVSVIDVMAKYKNFFLDVMMVEELGLMPPDEDDQPWKNGVVTFVAFVLFGFIPLLSYVTANATGASDSVNFIVACVLTGVTMFLLGAAKAKFTNQSMLRSALLMLLNGGMAAVAAYLVSWGIAEALGGDRDGFPRKSTTLDQKASFVNELLGTFGDAGDAGDAGDRTSPREASPEAKMDLRRFKRCVKAFCGGKKVGK